MVGSRKQAGPHGRMEVKRQNASLLSEAAVNARMRTLKQMVVAAAR